MWYIRTHAGDPRTVIQILQKLKHHGVDEQVMMSTEPDDDDSSGTELYHMRGEQCQRIRNIDHYFNTQNTCMPSIEAPGNRGPRVDWRWLLDATGGISPLEHILAKTKVSSYMGQSLHGHR